MSKITVVGLGAGEIDQLPLGMYKKIKNAKQLYIRTKEHPVIKSLEEEGLSYTSFDYIYEENSEFAHVYLKITDELLKAAKNKDITYAVPGHPLVAEETVRRLLDESKKQNIAVEIVGGQSFLDPMFNALQIDPIEGFQMVDGTSLKREELQIRQHIIICQVYDAFIASEVKLTLMELLPDDYEITVVTAAGTAFQQLITIPLYELDRVTEINNLTAVYVPPVQTESILYKDFDKLREVIATLRGPNGCPWDKKQTHQSLKPYLLEEAYEVLEAIEEEDEENLVEELGDVLLQIMLHAQIGEDEGWFSIADVIETLSEKMIRRHPHVFGTGTAEDAEEVVRNWDEIKKQEKGNNNKHTSLLGGIPKSTPALMRAYELQKKAAKVGFDWDNPAPMWMKLQEELAEFFTELKRKETEKAKKEFGDILFVLVNLGRFYDIHPEEALHMTNEKFFRRFSLIEGEVEKQGKKVEEMSLEELDAIWEQTKQTHQ